MSAQDPGSIPRRTFSTAARAAVRGLTILAAAAGFFWIAGRLDWAIGWRFVGLVAVGHGLSALWLHHRNPELLRRRGEIGAGTKRWDKIWLGIFGVCYLGSIAVGALDGGRLGWSRMPDWLWLPGIGLFAAHLLLLTRAMAENPHFEKTVRIQHDRDHRVIDTGPYRVVRHPGYAAIILGFIPTPPLLLGSWWAFIPAALATAALVVRTALEDATLQRELPGYAAYAQRVRYRLIPCVW